MRYTVGQIVFLLSRKDMKVFPAQIIEEITSKKIDGEKISYTARLPNRKQSEICLDDVDADVFSDAVTLEKFMVDSAKKSIDRVIKSAQDLSEKSFIIESNLEAAVLSEKEVLTPDQAEIDLGNGVTGRISLSDIPTELQLP
jgi:hypothetical protein